MLERMGEARNATRILVGNLFEVPPLKTEKQMVKDKYIKLSLVLINHHAVKMYKLVEV
jgi:hypothetical protein